MNSKLGHILSIQYANQPLHYPIIGAFRSKQTGLMHYVTPVWNEESKKFIDYREDSYFFRGVNQPPAPYFMSKQHKACSRAFRIQQLLKKSSKRLARAKSYALTTSTIAPQKSPSGQWRNEFEYTSEYPANEKRLMEVEALHAKLDELFKAEMAFAGITI